MKLCWMTCFLLCPFAIIPASAQTSARVNSKPLTPFEQTLIANGQALANAEKQKDVAFFKRTLTDDFVGVGTDGKLFDKNDVLENVRTADVQEYRPYNVQALPMSDGAGVVTYDCIVRMKLSDDSVPRYQHMSSIWVKQGEQWRLKFQQATPAEQGHD